jgi:hypothetical protein
LKFFLHYLYYESVFVDIRGSKFAEGDVCLSVNLPFALLSFKENLCKRNFFTKGTQKPVL